METQFRFAKRGDVPLILRFIKELAEYEGLLEEVVADERTLEEWIFDQKKAEVLFALQNGGDLDHGDTRAKSFDVRCPDEGRVVLHGQIDE